MKVTRPRISNAFLISDVDMGAAVDTNRICVSRAVTVANAVTVATAVTVVAVDAPVVRPTTGVTVSVYPLSEQYAVKMLTAVDASS